LKKLNELKYNLIVYELFKYLFIELSLRKKNFGFFIKGVERE